ncbi:unnamed protein product [marine sediment metagenome]|uniref:Uncharacterized protein n=1 Tax=marine sediment metagenome TaxID=412755 RepID=X1R030_9ZZZZ
MKARTFEGIVIGWIDELKAAHPKGRLTTPTIFDIRRLKGRLTSRGLLRPAPKEKR